MPKFFKKTRRSLQQSADAIAPYAALFNPYGGVWHLLKQSDQQEDYERAQKRREAAEMKMKREYYEKFLRDYGSKGSGMTRKQNNSILYTTAKLRAIIDK
jgi:hypothetical protein